MDLRLPDPEEAGFASVSGVRIAWDSFGRGEASVLIVPTWNFVDSRLSASLVRHLSSEFRVVTYDPRGAGRSDRPPEGYRLADHLADAVAVMEAAGVARASVVAASIGANQAALLAALRPEQVERLVLLGPAMAVGPDTVTEDDEDDPFWVERSTYDGWERWSGPYWRRDWPEFVRWFLEQVFIEPGSEPVIDAVGAIALEADPEILIQQRTEQRRGHDHLAAPAVLGRVTAPTLVLHGDRDLSVPLRVAEAIAAAIPNAILAVVVGGGHRPDLRSPELTHPLLAEFLRGHHLGDHPGIDVRARDGAG